MLNIYPYYYHVNRVTIYYLLYPIDKFAKPIRHYYQDCEILES
jgi:hypothetical protein